MGYGRRCYCSLWLSKMLKVLTRVFPSQRACQFHAMIPKVVNSLGMKKAPIVLQCRSFHPKSKGLKTKQAAAKRFIKTGSGHLKFNPPGKSHLNAGKSRVRLRRLNKKVSIQNNKYCLPTDACCTIELPKGKNEEEHVGIAMSLGKFIYSEVYLHAFS